jgi:phosphoglucan,water dikinase
LAAAPLTSATPATAGSKAYICGDLAAKALASGGLFKAPAGCVLPFGVMEALVAKAGKSDIVASSIAAAEGAAAASDYANLDAACESIRAALKGIEIPPEVCASIAQSFESAGFIAVRSSANVEVSLFKFSYGKLD